MSIKEREAMGISENYAQAKSVSLPQWHVPPPAYDLSYEGEVFSETKEELADAVPEGMSVYLGRCRVTAYCPCKKCCGKTDGITATGTLAAQGRTVAVDPKTIPYGSVVEINGHRYIAEDCGGGINGTNIDIFFDSHQEALVFGLQYLDVYLVTERSSK